MFKCKLRLSMVACMGASASGCVLEDFVVSDEFSLLWALVAFLIVAGMSTPTFAVLRRRQIQRWDIAASPTVPPAMPLTWKVVASAVTLFMAFLGYNLYIPDMDPKQIAINAVAWAVGSALGVLATDRLGRQLTDPKS